MNERKLVKHYIFIALENNNILFWPAEKYMKQLE